MKVKLIVEGGKMQPGPAVAQQLGPMGINIGNVISDVNEATKDFKGMNVPVELDVDPKTKKYDIKVLSPSMSELIKKELGVEKGSGESGKIWVGNMGIESLIKVAKTKMNGLLARDLKAALKLAVVSCVSLGILVENKNPKEVEEDIDSGKYDKEIKGEITEVSAEKKKELDNYFAEVSSEQVKKKKAEEEAEVAAATAKEEEGEAKPEEVVDGEGEEKKEEKK